MDYTQFKKLQLRGRQYRQRSIIDPDSHQEVGYIKSRLKLRDDLRVYGDQAMQHELLHIRARRLLNDVVMIGTIYDVVDSTDKQSNFSLRQRFNRKQISYRDNWDLLDPRGKVIGSIEEVTSTWRIILFILTQFVGFMPTATYKIRISQSDGSKLVAGTIRSRERFYAIETTLDMTNTQTSIDPRMSLTSMVVIDRVRRRMSV